MFIQGIHNYMPGKPHVSRVRTTTPFVVTVVTVLFTCLISAFRLLEEAAGSLHRLVSGILLEECQYVFLFVCGVIKDNS